MIVEANGVNPTLKGLKSGVKGTLPAGGVGEFAWECVSCGKRFEEHELLIEWNLSSESLYLCSVCARKIGVGLLLDAGRLLASTRVS